MKVFPKIDASKINQILADFLKKKKWGKENGKPFRGG